MQDPREGGHPPPKHEGEGAAGSGRDGRGGRRSLDTPSPASSPSSSSSDGEHGSAPPQSAQGWGGTLGTWTAGLGETIEGGLNSVRTMVSQDKVRFVADGFDLDLTCKVPPPPISTIFS